MAYPHGVYTSEQDTALAVPVEGTAGLQVIIGTAPVDTTESPAANTPVIAYSYAEAVEQLGYSDDWEKYTLCQSMYASFKVFAVAPIIMINVFDPERHKTDVPAETHTLVNSTVTIEQANVILSSVKAQKTDGTLLEKDTDYILNFNDKGYLEFTAVAGGAIESETEISISYSVSDVSKVTVADIIGGIDEDGNETGMEVIRQIYPKFNLVPGILLAPGWSQNADVTVALQAKTENINGVYNCTCMLDIDCSDSGARKYTDVKNQKEKQGASLQNAYAVWPKFAVGSNTFYASALAAAEMAYTDASNGDIPNLSPSNKNIRITAIVLEDGNEILLDQDQANMVNSFGVATAINMNGFKLWGNNTCIYPSKTDPKDRWYAVKRFFLWSRNNFIQTYFQKVDNPANYRLIESIVDSENIRGNSYVTNEYCAGYKIEFRASENPITSILDGKIKFHTMLAPYTPAEVIENVFEFDPVAIETALTGGGS